GMKTTAACTINACAGRPKSSRNTTDLLRLTGPGRVPRPTTYTPPTKPGRGRFSATTGAGDAGHRNTWPTGAILSKPSRRAVMDGDDQPRGRPDRRGRHRAVAAQPWATRDPAPP